MTPEQQARVSIDALLQQADWHVCSMADANIHPARRMALREFPHEFRFWLCRLLALCSWQIRWRVEANLKRAQALRQATLHKAFEAS